MSKKIKPVPEVMDLSGKFRAFNTVWDPHIAAEFGAAQLKLVKCIGPGDLCLHECDTVYLVFKGDLIVVTKDAQIELSAGQYVWVPADNSCKLASLRGAEVLIFDAKGCNRAANLYPERGKLKKI